MKTDYSCIIKKKICLRLKVTDQGKGPEFISSFLCIKMNWNENNVEILHNKGETEECIEF